MTQIDQMPEIDFSSLFLAHQSFSRELRRKGIKRRKNKLREIKKWLIDHQADIEGALYQDLAKPSEEACVTEIYPVLTEVRHAISKLSQWAAPRPVPSSMTFLGTAAYIYPEPKGTSLIISPWNYPLLLAIGPVVSSVAAGNTIVLKPSEFTPATNQQIGKMLSHIFDENEVKMVVGEADVATNLLALPFDHIFFTGSPAVGKIVMEAAAKNLTSVTLELGGKSPTIIDESADIGDAARKIAWGKWTNAGQTCVAPDYLYVHKSQEKRFIAELKRNTDRMYTSKSNYASIINQKHFGRLNSLIDDAINRGAEPLSMGKREGREIGPVILNDVNADMRIMQEEIFGPILPILSFSDLEEVIDAINSRPKPLALYLYSKSNHNKRRVLTETSSGSIVFNDNVLQFGHPQLAMGGVNHSGIGKAHGEAGFREFSHAKSVLKQRTGFTIASIVYPPYNSFKKWMINFMLKYF